MAMITAAPVTETAIIIVNESGEFLRVDKKIEWWKGDKVVSFMACTERAN